MISNMDMGFGGKYTGGVSETLHPLGMGTYTDQYGNKNIGEWHMGLESGIFKIYDKHGVQKKVVFLSGRCLTIEDSSFEWSCAVKNSHLMFSGYTDISKAMLMCETGIFKVNKQGMDTIEALLGGRLLTQSDSGVQWACAIKFSDF